MQYTKPPKHIDPKAKLDSEAITELFDNEQYADVDVGVGGFGQLVYDFLNREILFPSQKAIDFTEEIKDRAFEKAHQWGVDGKKAANEVRKIACEVAIEKIIAATSFDDIETQEGENALWAEALADPKLLTPQEIKITLLSTTPLIYEGDDKEAKPLSIAQIVTAFNENNKAIDEKAVETTIKDAEDKIRKHISYQILTRGGQ